MNLIGLAFWMFSAGGDGLRLEEPELPFDPGQDRPAWVRELPLALEAGGLGAVAFFNDSPPMTGGGAYLEASWAFGAERQPPRPVPALPIQGEG